MIHLFQYAADSRGIRLSRLLIGTAMLLVLSGCATYSASLVKVEADAANRNLDGAIKSLDELKLSGADETLHYLNKATLLRLQEKYAESNQYFERAKVLMERLNAISVAEQAASVSVNDTMKAYEGLPNEQLMVYSFEALNYLQLGAVDEAAVEARQFDVKQGRIAAKNKSAKYLSGAFVRYLNSMVYEAAGERDSARIEMQKAIDGYRLQNGGFPVPQALATDLKRVTAGVPAASEVTFVLHNGLGPSLDEQNIRVDNPNPGTNGPLMFSLAMPRYVKRPVPVDHVVISAAAGTATSEIVEDVNAIGERSFNDRLPVIMSRGIARMVIKNVAAQETKKQAGDNPWLKLAADLTTNLSERADTRTWSLLPGNLLMARLVLPAGVHQITATYYGVNGNVVGSRQFNGIEVKAGKRVFLSDYVMNPPAAAKPAN